MSLGGLAPAGTAIFLLVIGILLALGVASAVYVAQSNATVESAD